MKKGTAQALVEAWILLLREANTRILPCLQPRCAACSSGLHYVPVTKSGPDAGFTLPHYGLCRSESAAESD